jgi:hypothetical protein
MGRQSTLKRSRREARVRELNAATARLRRAESRGCLFCRKGDGGFRSREHTFAESLGNVELFLPNGIVCDRCNNGTLSALDQAICEFGPIKMRRTMLGISSKSGRVPITKMSEGTIECVEPGSLRFDSNSKHAMLKEIERDGNTVRLEFNFSGGRRLTPRYASELSRAVLKSALECAWFDHGESVFESRFDHVRSAVLGTPRNGFIAIGRRANPQSTSVTLTYQFVTDTSGLTHLFVVADYFGILLVTDSRLGQPFAEIPALHMTGFSSEELRAA